MLSVEVELDGAGVWDHDERDGERWADDPDDVAPEDAGRCGSEVASEKMGGSCMSSAFPLEDEDPLAAGLLDGEGIGAEESDACVSALIRRCCG